MKSQHQRRIEKFMDLAGQEVPTVPTVPSPEVRILRAKLILKEALETIEGLGVNIVWEIQGLGSLNISGSCGLTFLTDLAAGAKFDMEKAVDGCGDLSVVTIGTLSALGVEDEPVLKEVDEANLRKFEPPKCSSSAHDHFTNATREMSFNGDQWVCECGSRRSVKDGPYKREDGKFIKPPYFKPADIKKVLENQEAIAKGGIFHPIAEGRGPEFDKWFLMFPGFLNVPGGTKLNKGHLYDAFVGGWEARINSEQGFKKKSVTSYDGSSEVSVPTPIPAPKFKVGDQVSSPAGGFTVGCKRYSAEGSRVPSWEYTTSYGTEWWDESQLSLVPTPASKFKVGDRVWFDNQKCVIVTSNYGKTTGPTPVWHYLLDNKKKLVVPEVLLEVWKPKRVHISVHGDSLRSHRGWWATLDKPGIEKDNYALFIDALPGGVVDEGEVIDVVPPDAQFTFTDHAPIDFGDKVRWWKIIYKPEPIK